MYEDGRPAVGANLFPIMAGHEDEWSSVQQVADDNGRFILHGMNPGGTYKVRFLGASVRGQQDLEVMEDGAVYVVQGQPTRRVQFVPLGPDGPLDLFQLCIVMFDHPDGPTKTTSTVYEPARKTDSEPEQELLRL